MVGLIALPLRWIVALSLMFAGPALHPSHAPAGSATRDLKFSQSNSAAGHLAASEAGLLKYRATVPTPLIKRVNGHDDPRAPMTPVARVRNVTELKACIAARLDGHHATSLAIAGRRALPSTVLVDTDGQLHRLTHGKLGWDYPNTAKTLLALVVRKPVVRNDAKPPAIRRRLY